MSSAYMTGRGRTGSASETHVTNAHEIGNEPAYITNSLSKRSLSYRTGVRPQEEQ